MKADATIDDSFPPYFETINDILERLSSPSYSEDEDDNNRQSELLSSVEDRIREFDHFSRPQVITHSIDFRAHVPRTPTAAVPSQLPVATQTGVSPHANIPGFRHISTPTQSSFGFQGPVVSRMHAPVDRTLSKPSAVPLISQRPADLQFRTPAPLAVPMLLLLSPELTNDSTTSLPARISTAQDHHKPASGCATPSDGQRRPPSYSATLRKMRGRPRLDGLPVGSGPRMKTPKKRGRPVGSKNKPKESIDTPGSQGQAHSGDAITLTPTQISEGPVATPNSTSKKRGRPVGSKNKAKAINVTSSSSTGLGTMCKESRPSEGSKPYADHCEGQRIAVMVKSMSEDVLQMQKEWRAQAGAEKSDAINRVLLTEVDDRHRKIKSIFEEGIGINGHVSVGSLNSQRPEALASIESLLEGSLLPTAVDNMNSVCTESNSRFETRSLLKTLAHEPFEIMRPELILDAQKNTGGSKIVNAKNLDSTFKTEYKVQKQSLKQEIDLTTEHEARQLGEKINYNVKQTFKDMRTVRKQQSSNKAWSKAPSGINAFQPLSATEIEKSDEPSIKEFGMWVSNGMISSPRKVIAYQKDSNIDHDDMSQSSVSGSSDDMGLSNRFFQDEVDTALADEEAISSDILASSHPYSRETTFLPGQVRFAQPKPASQAPFPRKRGRPAGSKLIDGKLVVPLRDSQPLATSVLKPGQWKANEAASAANGSEYEEAFRNRHEWGDGRLPHKKKLKKMPVVKRSFGGALPVLPSPNRVVEG